MEKILITPEEAAEALSFGRTTIYELIGSGELQSVKIGRARRIPASALQDDVDETIATAAATACHAAFELVSA